MNKKILTLLAAGFMGSLSVSAFAAPSTGYTANNLHQLTASNGKVLSVMKSKVSSADSLVMVKAPTDQMSEAYKKTLWKITETKVDNTTTTVYTFTNHVTGKVLSLNLAKTDGTIAAGQSSWLVNDVYPSSVTDAITAIKNGVRYGIYLETVMQSDGVTPVTLPDGTNDYKVRLSAVSANAPEQFTFAQPASILGMSKDEINGLYGTSSSFTFSQKAEGNPIDGVAFRAETDAAIPGYVNLHLNNGKYLVVDTVVWKNSVNNNKYWKLTTSDKPTTAAAATSVASGISATVLENGRAAETYAFKVDLDIAAGYKLTITPFAVPVYNNSAELEGRQTVFSYDAVTTSRPLSYGQFASSTLVLTASEVYRNDQLTPATAVFGTVETPNTLDGNYTYYIQDYNTHNSRGNAINKNYTQYVYYSDCQGGRVKANSTVATPGYMWYLTSAGALNNMWNTAATYGGSSITLIDEANGIYAFDNDTLKLTKGPKVADAKMMGYKTVSAADEANGALSFRLVSALAQDLYVVENEGVLYVANGELSDALKLKVVNTVTTDINGDGVVDYNDYATETGSNGVIKPVYQFTDRLGSRTLVSDAAGTGFTLLTPAEIAALNTNTIPGTSTLDPSDDVFPVEASFLAVDNDNKYKIVFTNRYSADLAFTANAASGIMTSTAPCDDDNIIFEFAKKEAPVYGAPKFGHVQITTLEDDNKMIAPQLDGFAALKREGQILKSDVYTNDTLKLWLDTALVDEIMPLYYLSSSAFNEEGDLRKYLINPLNINSNGKYDFAAASGLGMPALRTAFISASQDKHKCLVLGKDTISTIELNPAAIAFEVAAEISEDAYRIVSPLDWTNRSFNPNLPVTPGNLPYVAASDWYLAQLNNVLFWTQDDTKAEVFVINRTTAPTANEAVEAESGVEVIAGQGVVTVQGAAGKVITVANILGQTIANQVAASDNVTIAAPAGVVVVTVDGEVVKTIVK